MAEDSVGAYFGAAERGATNTALGLTSDTEGPISMPKADQNSYHVQTLSPTSHGQMATATEAARFSKSETAPAARLAVGACQDGWKEPGRTLHAVQERIRDLLP